LRMGKCMRAGKTGVSTNFRERRTDGRIEEREKEDTMAVGEVCVRVRGRRAQGKNVERAGRDLYS